MNMLAALALLSCAQEVLYPARPAERDFVVDEAGILKPEDIAEIRRIADEALTKKKAPIVVVTIKSLKSKGVADWPLQRYAMNLMSEWKVGWSSWNYGMVILVSVEDRKARIELGAGWGRTKDADAQRVMNELMVPHFKKGEFGRGAVEGVKGLQALALGLSPPRAPAGQRVSSEAGSWTWILIAIVGIAVVGSMLRGGSMGGGGFGSSFGAGCLGAMIGNMLFGSLFGGGSAWGSDSGGGDWGGGSFGDGFSGGGGADGSW